MRDQIPAKFLFALVLYGIFYSVNAQAKTAVSADTLSFRSIHNQASTTINSLTSLLIQQNGDLLTERYFNGMQKGEATNIKSASKSIISLLVGIAVDNEFIEDINQPIKPYFTDYFAANPDSVKENITIKNLLTMQSGLETTSFHNYGRWVISDDWVKFALDQPIEKQPGSDMVYSSGTSHLLSAIITKSTGMSTKAFAEKYLFRPMGIITGGWDRGPQGYYMGGNNMALKPTDMIKIGQMVLNGGVYQGEQIVSADWLEQSFQTYTRSNFNPYNYGYMWWKKQVGGHQVHFAWGFGGQYIFMIPSLDAVIVMTGSLGNADQSRSYKEPVFRLLREHIIPLLSDAVDI